MATANRNGRPASCPGCGVVFTYGLRNCPREEKRFCSEECTRKYQRASDRLRAVDFTGDPYKAVQQAIDASNQKTALERAQVSKARRQRIVWCNSCVKQIIFYPSHDSNECKTCGYGLSVYGPFDARPSWSSSTLLKPNDRQLVQAIGTQ